jgi:glycosyltransferase involved in cell wall biosynthesis
VNVPVSIIIPTYNEEKYLPTLLQSIKDQTAQPSEVIIADANSTDQTKKIALSFGCKIIQGGNPQRGRNNGAKIAKSNNLLFLDADNVLPKTFLERTVEEFQKRNLDISSCFAYVPSPTLMESIGAAVTNFYYKITEKIRPHVYGFCIFAKKKLHDEIKGFDESVVLADDQEYALRAGKKGVFGFLHSEKIPVAMRRYEKEGKIITTLKYIFMEFHLILLGPIRKQIFSYGWGKFKKIKN